MTTEETAITPASPTPDATTPGRVELPKWRHVKTGGEYEEIGRGRTQTAGPLTDMSDVVIYRSLTDGGLWCRPRSEFEDGRFERLPAAALTPSPSAVMDETERLVEKAQVARAAWRECAIANPAAVSAYAERDTQARADLLSAFSAIRTRAETAEAALAAAPTPAPEGVDLRAAIDDEIMSLRQAQADYTRGERDEDDGLTAIADAEQALRSRLAQPAPSSGTDVDVLRVLKSLEWSVSTTRGGFGSFACCPVCEGAESVGHETECALRTVLGTSGREGKR